MGTPDDATESDRPTGATGPKRPRFDPRLSPTAASPGDLADRIRSLGLPDAVARIALDGGSALHPSLAALVDSVNAAAWSMVRRHPHLVPLWSSGTLAMLAAPDGSIERWSAEWLDGPLRVDRDWAATVRELLTDLWELDADDAVRREVAALLLPADGVDAALVPIER